MRENECRLYSFIRDLDHSLGSPLNSLLSSQERIVEFSKCLQASDRDSALKIKTIQKRAVNIGNNIARIERYRRRLEDFINIGYLNKALVFKCVKINDLIVEITERFIQEAAPEYFVDLRRDLDPSLTTARLDPVALEIILENLLDNALYAVQPCRDENRTEKPRIVVKTRLKKNLLRSASKIEISVIDNGPGIPPNKQKEIFKPFVSGTSNHKQGIGLYLVDMLVNLYNGKIELISTSNGSNFSFVIPYVKK